MPEKNAEVGSVTVPKVPPPNLCFIPAENEMQAAGTAGASSMGMFVPPNMSEVLYKESYEEFIKDREPMELKSFCWTPKQNLYVGCAGGQLVSVEFESGCVSVLVNPCPAMEVCSGSGRREKSLYGPLVHFLFLLDGEQ